MRVGPPFLEVWEMLELERLEESLKISSCRRFSPAFRGAPWKSSKTEMFSRFLPHANHARDLQTTGDGGNGRHGTSPARAPRPSQLPTSRRPREKRKGKGMNNMNNTKCASKRLPSRVRRSLVTRLIASTTSKTLASSSRSGERKAPGLHQRRSGEGGGVGGLQPQLRRHLSDRDLLRTPRSTPVRRDQPCAGLRDEYNELPEDRHAGDLADGPAGRGTLRGGGA